MRFILSFQKHIIEPSLQHRMGTRHPGHTSLSILLLVHKQSRTAHQHHSEGLQGSKLWESVFLGCAGAIHSQLGAVSTFSAGPARLSSPLSPSAFPGSWSTECRSGVRTCLGHSWTGWGRAFASLPPSPICPPGNLLRQPEVLLPACNRRQSCPSGPGRLSLATSYPKLLIYYSDSLALLVFHTHLSGEPH